MAMDNSVVIVGTGDMRVINGNRKIIIKTKKKTYSHELQFSCAKEKVV